MPRDEQAPGRSRLESVAMLIAAAALVGAALRNVRHADADTETRRTSVEPTPPPAAARGGIRGAIDQFQQRHRPLAFMVGVIRKFGDERAGRLAALIAYYGFFSIFPLLLAASTILAFVADRGEADRFENSALSQIPVLGDQIGGSAATISGSGAALIVGVALALWAGLACMQAAQDAMNDVWSIPRVAQPGYLPKRLRSIASLAVIGASFLVSTFATQAITALPDLPGIARVAGLVLSVVVNAAVFLLMFQVLATTHQPWRDLVPGAAIGGIGYTALQTLGHLYVDRTIKGASDTYGTFAIVIGLLSWLYLLGQFMLLAAEINVVRARHLWPRSLFPPKLTRADRKALAAAARAQQARPEQRIDVSFDGLPDGSHEHR
jgi:YihY family inner membrane protein